MKLPTEYHDDILAYPTSVVASYPDGTPIRPRVYSLIFPPPGFFPFYDIGNGDYQGFYWPVGREDGPPIVACSSHDVSSLIPENSDIDSFYRCQLPMSNGDTEDPHYSRDLAERANGKAPPEHDIRDLKCDDFNTLLSLDPTSPFYLCATGDVHVSNNEIEAAEKSYRESLDQLPEYVAAHFGLACVLRRQRRVDEATIYLRQCLLGRLAFYGGSFWSDISLPGTLRNDWHRKALMWLQRSKTFHESIADDPFIRSIGKFTFRTGLAVNPDLDVLRTIIDEYAANGCYADAARTWQLVGDLACIETHTFRERYNLNPTAYGTRLAQLFELAGNGSRAKLIRNMLTQMRNPEGQYL